VTVNSVVIVGASLAGVRTADALRSRGFSGPLTIVGDEHDLPYDRPPLSKQFLAGNFDDERLLLRATDSYAADRLELALGATALSAHITQRTVEVGLASGATVRADALVIATGARLRPPPFPVTHAKVHELRTRVDAVRLRPELQPGVRVVVIGAGFIGAEVASTAKALGAIVTIVEAASAPLVRQLGEEMGIEVAGLHKSNGVELVLGASVTSVESDAVVLGDGTRIIADVVVIGIGVIPNLEWLAGSGIDVADGVRCDETLRARTTSGSVFDNVVAVGDIARFPNRLFDEEMRIEHWTNAVESATHVAGSLFGEREGFAPIPYFWSDQYDKKIQFLGRSTNFDEVAIVNGSVAEGSWLALYRRNDRIVGALGVSKIRAVMAMRRLIGEAASWETAIAAARAK
jgi:NADPH-dependent 2,4-dienoyl-CoA reductase/sulfur reductase-like enzyme